MKRFTILALLSLSVLVAACNTVEGLGRDIKRGGQKLESAAR
jgi:predicted small secreted protein